MNLIETTFVLLFVAMGTVTLAPRFRIPIEVLWLLGSLAISLIPGLPTVTLPPDLVFILLMPPILFAAAYFTSWRDFKANTRPISFLAIGLVLFTTVAVAAVVKWLVPGVSWPVGFLLGAMISPPDAAAATAITKKLGVPRRMITIIEGESLVNDATALVAYRFAIAAIVTGHFSLGFAAAKFIWLGVGGALVGFGIAWLGIWLYRHLRETTAQTLLTFLTAFAAYVSGEALGVSGVISTVVAGLYFGRQLPAHASAESRIESKASWDLVLFVINGLVFTLIGFELPIVLRGLHGMSRWTLTGQALLVSLAVMLVRFLWVFPATYIPRLIAPGIRRKDPIPSWRVLIVMSWTAMRGIVSLAAALSLPTVLPDGQAFPYRDMLIFFTYVAIMTTLLLPSFTLPWILEKLGIKAGNERQREETTARIAATRAVLAAIEQDKAKANYPAPLIDQFRNRYHRRLDTLESNMNERAFSPLHDEDRELRRLLRDLISLERMALIKLRSESQIHDEVFHSITRELDIEDLRLHTQRI